MSVEPVSITFLYGGRVAPLTQLEVARPEQPGRFDGGVYDRNGRVCEAGLQIKSAYQNEPAPCPAGAPVQAIAGRHIFGGMLQNEHFGHFMAESLTRLWATRPLSGFDSVVFYLRNPQQPIAGFAQEMLTLLVPEVHLTVVSALTAFDLLAVPTQIGARYGGFIYGHPAIREVVDGLPTADPSGPKKVYVSRSRLNAREGGLLLESVIEESLQAEGYAIAHPQEMSIRDQITLYRAADRIIFADGSALHLYALVARPDQQAFVIWRRKKNAGFDWQIQSFGGKPTAGIPCIRTLWVPEPDPTATVQAQAALDFTALRDQLTSSGFISGQTWKVPAPIEFEEGLERVRARMRTGFVPYPLELIGPNLTTSPQPSA